MKKRALITGGAGFIGSHLADELLNSDYTVRVLDSLCAQVHGVDQRRPGYLDSDVELVVGDIRDRSAVCKALEGVDCVCHLAAAVGVAQSMYQIEHYISVNSIGTAVLLEQLVEHPVEKLVVASSMSLYGEGLYRDASGYFQEGADRSLEDLRAGQWEVMDVWKTPLTPVPTPETKRPSLTSVYALGKYNQERLCLMTGQAFHIPTVALRFFNVYGPRQALSNPYTGVLAIFSSRLLNDHPPIIFEDGGQSRDFVSVHDVARACRLALETPAAAGRVLNIGSGQALSVYEVAMEMRRILGKDMIEPSISNRYRVGDIRHCFADISAARAVLDYKPSLSFEDGLVELADWLGDQTAMDRTDTANAELASRGLTV